MKPSVIISCLALLSPFLGFTQRCNEQDKIDPVTDDIMRTTKVRITSPTPFYLTTYYREGSKYQIKVEVGDSGEKSHTIPKGSELIIRTGAGEVLRINSIEEVNPELSKEYGDNVTKFTIFYEVSEEQMKMIADSGITFMRGVDFKNTFSDLVIPDPVRDLIKSNVSCLFR